MSVRGTSSTQNSWKILGITPELQSYLYIYCTLLKPGSFVGQQGLTTHLDNEQMNREDSTYYMTLIKKIEPMQDQKSEMFTCCYTVKHVNTELPPLVSEFTHCFHICLLERYQSQWCRQGLVIFWC